MACPTCEHTMHLLFEYHEHAIYWCPRCGTLHFNCDDVDRAPQLVERCRKYESQELIALAEEKTSWVQLGIAEAIRLPDDRVK